MHTGKVYLIGGVSGSGKSYAAKFLADLPEKPLSIIALDNFYNSIRYAYDSIGEKAWEKGSRSAKDCVFQIARDALSADVTCMIEGTWIEPEKAAKLKNEFGEKFHSVFCGYPDDTAEKRLAEFKNRKSKHWTITNRTSEEALKHFESQIKRSKEIQAECEQYDLPFANFSSFHQGFGVVYDHFRSVFLQGNVQ